VRALAPARTRSDDQGFTLIEVLVAIVLMGIITAPLANVVIQFMGLSDLTTARVEESNDAQIAGAYFAQDVSSIGTRDAADNLLQSVETAAPYGTGLYPCGVTGTPNAVVRFAWDDFTSSTTEQLVTVAYVVKTVSGRTELHRLRCVGTSKSPVSDNLLSDDLDPLTAPVLACSTTCTAAPAVPMTVTLTLTIKAVGNNGTAYVVALSGQRRQT
jgi:prepilin-type N-terminal cleavage/methylation domain-containing protein